MSVIFDPLLGQLRTDTPDASSTVKGKLKLTGDLGGTADAPTTPTAVHITGDETIEGNKTFSNLVKVDGNFALGGLETITLSDLGYETALSSVSAVSYFVTATGGDTYDEPFYVGCSNGEVFRVGNNNGGIWTDLSRGLFGTKAAPIPSGADFTIYPTNALTGWPISLTVGKYTVDVNASTSINGAVLPDPLSTTIPDGTTIVIGDFYNQFSPGSGYGIIITEPSTGTEYEIYETGVMAICTFSEITGRWAVIVKTPDPTIPPTPDKFIVKAASTSNLTGSYNSGSKKLNNTSGTMDGVTINVGDRVLLKNQSTATRNGVYERIDSNNYQRVAEFFSESDLAAGQVFTVCEGSTQADTQWVITTDGDITIDTTSIAFSRIAGTKLKNIQITSSSTITPTADTADQYDVTALAANATIAAPSGTPVNGQRLILRIKDNGTARTLTWNAIYRSVGPPLPSTTIVSKTLYVHVVYNTADTKWDVIDIRLEGLGVYMGAAYGSTTVPQLYGIDDDTGLSFTNNNVISFIAASVTRATLTNTYLRMTVPIEYADGTAAAPSVTNTGDTDTGVYFPDTDEVGVSAGGTLRLTIGTTAVTSTLPYIAPVGSAAAPSYTFTGDTDTGIYRIGADNLGIATNGTLVVDVSTTGVDVQGSLRCDSIVNDTGLAAGTYTPTLTNVTNISASTAYQCQYMRVGNTVTVSGKVDIDQDTPGAYELGISLPVSSNFGAEEDCAGIGAGVANGDDPAWIKADATNDRASLNAHDTDASNHAHYFTFTYQVI